MQSYHRTCKLHSWWKIYSWVIKGSTTLKRRWYSIGGLNRYRPASMWLCRAHGHAANVRTNMGPTGYCKGQTRWSSMAGTPTRFCPLKERKTRWIAVSGAIERQRPPVASIEDEELRPRLRESTCEAVSPSVGVASQGALSTRNDPARGCQHEARDTQCDTGLAEGCAPSGSPPSSYRTLLARCEELCWCNQAQWATPIRSSRRYCALRGSSTGQRATRTRPTAVSSGRAAERSRAELLCSRPLVPLSPQCPQSPSAQVRLPQRVARPGGTSACAKVAAGAPSPRAAARKRCFREDVSGKSLAPVHADHRVGRGGLTARR